MKYIKLYEQFNDVDPYGEEQCIEPDGTFLTFLKMKYPDENSWSEITRMDCFNQNLHTLEGIENLVNLKRLHCSNNLLTNLNGVEKLINLKGIDCSNNQLTNLNGIENLVNLKWLYCKYNNFTKEYKKYLKNYYEEREIYIWIEI